MKCALLPNLWGDVICHFYRYTPFPYLGHISLFYQKRLNIAGEIIATCPHSPHIVHLVTNFRVSEA